MVSNSYQSECLSNLAPPNRVVPLQPHDQVLTMLASRLQVDIPPKTPDIPQQSPLRHTRVMSRTSVSSNGDSFHSISEDPRSTPQSSFRGRGTQPPPLLLFKDNTGTPSPRSSPKTPTSPSLQNKFYKFDAGVGSKSVEPLQLGKSSASIRSARSKASSMRQGHVRSKASMSTVSSERSNSHDASDVMTSVWLDKSNKARLGLPRKASREWPKTHTHRPYLSLSEASGSQDADLTFGDLLGDTELSVWDGVSDSPLTLPDASKDNSSSCRMPTGIGAGVIVTSETVDQPDAKFLKGQRSKFFKKLLVRSPRPTGVSKSTGISEPMPCHVPGFTPLSEMDHESFSSPPLTVPDLTQEPCSHERQSSCSANSSNEFSVETPSSLSDSSNLMTASGGSSPTIMFRGDTTSWHEFMQRANMITAKSPDTHLVLDQSGTWVRSHYI